MGRVNLCYVSILESLQYLVLHTNGQISLAPDWIFHGLGVCWVCLLSPVVFYGFCLSCRSFLGSHDLAILLVSYSQYAASAHVSIFVAHANLIQLVLVHSILLPCFGLRVFEDRL